MMEHANWIQKWSHYAPDSIMLEVDGGDRWSYARASRLVHIIADCLQQRHHIGRGDRVAVLSQNVPECIFLFYALQELGAIMVPLNFRLAAPELAYVLEDAGAKLLIHQQQYEQTVAALDTSSGPETAIFEEMKSRWYRWETEYPLDGEQCSEAAEAEAAAQAGGGRTRETVLPGSAAKTAAHAVPEPAGLSSTDPYADRPSTDQTGAAAPADTRDVCMILYTSGTTGRPKGAMITRTMLFWNSINTGLRLNLTQQDVTLVFAPFFHTGGWNVLTTPFIHRGARLVMIPKFDPDRVLQLCDEHGVSILFGVPTMMDMMYRSPAFADARLNELRYAVVGGEPMPLPLIKAWHEKGVPVRQGYGLTEFGPNVFSLNEEDAVRKIGSIGFPNFYIDARVVDDEGRDVPTGARGELILRGPVCMKGYWNNPEATAAAIKDGWLYTGDIVMRDGEGYFYVVDRKKDMYISGAENVYPAEIEHFLRTHEAVQEVAVIGVPDEKWGESGMAFVVLRSGAVLPAEDLLAYCSGKLANYKIPKHIRFLDQLPKSDSGKILKRQLREGL